MSLRNDAVKPSVKISSNSINVSSSSGTELAVTGSTMMENVVSFLNRESQLQRRLKEAYGIKPGYGLSYGHAKIEGGGIVIDKGDLR